ncbi:hypothetical protein AMR42_07980 [Limnothrix sp. PR1529]|nr:hypothetical protein BCR12_03370 [Limnothrix sp. P13C2]PIB13923.1 hypothetical protein AMR42_07980 [Limnothrix sp. PR1529]
MLASGSDRDGGVDGEVDPAGDEAVLNGSVMGLGNRTSRRQDDGSPGAIARDDQRFPYVNNSLKGRPELFWEELLWEE